LGNTTIDVNNMAAIVGHPIRCRALVIFADRVASSSDIARDLGIDLNQVAYHVRTLRKFGLIEEVDSRPVRGAIERRYRAVKYPLFSDSEYAALSPQRRTRFSRDILSLATAEANASLASGKFGSRADHHISRMPLRVDEEGWQELIALYRDALQRLFEIRGDAEARLAAGEEDGTAVIAFNTFFEAPPT